jgi:S-adenosylmethionine:tRNA ribosyltransferase-isomerase
MDTAAFDYELPDERIAQEPLAVRDAAWLLVDEGPGSAPADRTVRDLPSLLEPGDLVVLNHTRVLPARLPLRRPSGGAAEVLLLEEQTDGSWSALVRPSRRLAEGVVLHSERAALRVEIGTDHGEGLRTVRLETPAGRSLLESLDAAGEVPLPPYIRRRLVDPERYQTVFAASDAVLPQSVAAPTAGLHLTERVLRELAERGITVASLELAVGLGTFRPIKAETVEDHVMHAERYRVPESTWAQVERAERVVAIGTTTVRALESVAATGRLEGRTELFIHGDYPFAVVDRLLTNFHQPRSSLLVMIDAFVGPRWRPLYEHALAHGYRFLSFGDAMLLTRRDHWGTRR